MRLICSTRAGLFSLIAAATIPSIPAQAGVGDLLVAPTRVVLDGRRGTEVILNNIGDDVATYRVSVELRRMTPDGHLVDVETPSANDKIAQDMVLYAPRRITLPPNQPQAIRLSARAPPACAALIPSSRSMTITPLYRRQMPDHTNDAFGLKRVTASRQPISRRPARAAYQIWQSKLRTAR